MIEKVPINEVKPRLQKDTSLLLGWMHLPGGWIN